MFESVAAWESGMKFQDATWNLPGRDARVMDESQFSPRLKLLRWLGRQTWIPRGQDWMMRKILDPDSSQSFFFEVDFFGLRYPGNMAQFIDWAVFAYGSHAYCELTLLEALAKEIRKKQDRVVFFDVGANVGHHTLFMANKADRVLAFEPFPPLQQLIAQKIAINNLTNVEIVPFGLGETDETLRYYPGGAANSGTGTFMPEEVGTYQQPIDLPIRNADRLFIELGLPRIDLLKVDIEGFEPAVFRGLANRILRDRPPVLSELTKRSRIGFGGEAAFRALFWEGAVFAEVSGRNGYPFQLKPFHYETTGEMLIVPPEMGGFVHSRIASN
jgi:FkbM family methyltransferase